MDTNCFLDIFTIVIPGPPRDGPIPKAVCYFCYRFAQKNNLPASATQTFLKEITPAVAHFIKCKHALARPGFVRALDELDPMALSSSPSSANLSRKSETNLSGPSKRQKRTTFDGCVQEDPKPSEAEIWEYHKALIDFIASTGIPYSVVDSPQFRKLLSLDNLVLQRYPNIILDKSALSSNVLKRRVLEVRSKMASKVEMSRVITLCFYSWTNIAGACMFAVVSLNEKGERHIIEYRDVSEKSHYTAEMILQLDSAINNPLVKGKVKAFVTSSASSLVEAKIELGSKYPELLFLPCFSHQINLIMGQLLNSLDNFLEYMKLCKEVVREINANPSRVKLLKRWQKNSGEQQLRLVSYCDTRWNSTKEMLDKISMSKISLPHAFYELSNTKSHTKAQRERFSTINETLTNPDFWKCLAQAQGLISVVAKFETLLQSGTARLDMVLPALYSILQHMRCSQFPLLDVKQFEEKTTKRLQDATWNVELLLIAFFLVPKPNFSMSEMIKPEARRLTDITKYCIKYYKKFFKKNPETLAEEIGRFDKHEDLPNDPLFKIIKNFGKQVNELFWIGYSEHSLPELTELACHIFGISVNSASVESLFSDMGDIYSKKRNRRLPQNDVLALAQIKNSLAIKRKVNETGENCSAEEEKNNWVEGEIDWAAVEEEAKAEEDEIFYGPGGLPSILEAARLDELEPGAIEADDFSSSKFTVDSLFNLSPFPEDVKVTPTA